MGLSKVWTIQKDLLTKGKSEMSITIYHSSCDTCGWAKYDRKKKDQCPDCGSYDIYVITEPDEHEEKEQESEEN